MSTCMQEGPHPKRWNCTLLAGHTGQHEAKTAFGLYTWPNDTERVSPKTIDELDALHAADAERIAFSARLRAAEAALRKIDAIRNSIVGLQAMSFSEHVYPLVAALNEAGYPGEGYTIARANVGTLLDRATKAEAEVERLRGEVASLALLTNPQAARDAAATERESRAALAILAPRDGEGLVTAAMSAMATVDLYKAMWRRDAGHTGLASQALHVGLKECERLREALREAANDMDSECDGAARAK